MSAPNIFPGGSGIPSTYDPRWTSYTNLTQAQIAAFQAFPQDLIGYASTVRMYYELRVFPLSMSPLPNPYIIVGGVNITMTTDNLTKIDGLAIDAQLNPNSTYNFTVRGTVTTLTAAQALALFNGIRSYIQQCRDIEATMINGINATPPTITLRSQIDAAFAALN